MLKTILSISGKPGLFKLISQAKNMLIVESLQTGKRQPAYAHEKIISLGDIAFNTSLKGTSSSSVKIAISPFNMPSFFEITMMLIINYGCVFLIHISINNTNCNMTGA